MQKNTPKRSIYLKGAFIIWLYIFMCFKSLLSFYFHLSVINFSVLWSLRIFLGLEPRFIILMITQMRMSLSKAHPAFPTQFLFKNVYLSLVALGLCCCVCAFSSCCVSSLRWLLECCQAQTLDQVLSSCSTHRLSCPAACGIFLDRTCDPYTGRQILYHWTTRKVP